MRRTRVLIALVEVAFAAALLGAAAHQHAHAGVERELIALGLLLVPAHLRRLLTCLGRAPAPNPLLLVLEAVALAGTCSYPVAPWGVGVATVLACLLGTSTTREKVPAPTPPWLAVGTALANAAAILLLGRDVVVGSSLAVVRLVLLAPIVAEALAPARPRSALDDQRRTAAVFTFAGTSWSQAIDLIYPLAYLATVAGLHLASFRAEPAERPRVRRRLGLRLAVPVLALALALALGEAIFHVVPNRYRELVPARGANSYHGPGTEYVYEGALLGPRVPVKNVFHWNKAGWHDADHELEKPAGTARIVVLGDSYVEGVQVALDELYHRRLEKGLAARSNRPVEAIGLGWAGWGQAQELECLRTTGLRYRPDLVVLEFLPGNDVRNNQDRLEQLANDEGSRSTFARVLFIKSINASLFFHAFLFDKLDLTLRRAGGHRDPVDSDVYSASPAEHSELWKEAWDRTDALVGDTKAELDRRGVPLVVAIFTSPLEIEACVSGPSPDPRYDFSIPRKRMAELCRRRGIACVDLAPRFAKLPADARPGLHLLPYDGHWSALGHREGASETVRFLTEETTLWQDVLKRVQAELPR